MSRKAYQTASQWTGPDPAKNKGKSLTQPNLTLSLQTLLERHTRGMPVPIREPIYNDPREEGTPDLSTMVMKDNIERVMAMEDNHIELDGVIQTVEEAKKAKKAAEKAAEMEAYYTAKKAEEEAAKQPKKDESPK